MVTVASHPDDIVFCVDTNDWRRIGDCFKANDGTFWSDENNLDDCDDCGAATGVDELEDNHGRCQSCDEHYVDCEGCSERIHNEDSIYEGNEHWCHSCHSEEFTACEDCSETIRRDDSNCVNDCRCVCNSCNDDYYRCEGCDGSYHRDNISFDDDRAYCEDCMPENRSTVDIGRVVCSDRSKETRSLRKFGIELETHRCGSYSGWLDSTGWGAKYDGSIQGMEFVSPPLSGDDGLASVRRVTGYMDNADWQVNRSCGYHLHCDLSDTTAAQRKSIALAYCYTADVWELFVADHRRDNSYARKNANSQHGRYNGIANYWDRDSINAGNDYPQPRVRYIWLNWAAYSEHTTVEVRSHEGTIDGVAVCNWVKAHIRFIDFVAKHSAAQITRIFGGKTKEQMFSEMTKIWDDSALSDYYGRKSGIKTAECAEVA